MMHRAPRWLQVSKGHSQQLCVPDSKTLPASVLRVAHTPSHPFSPSAATGSDVATSSDAHLQMLLAATDLDHAFYVQPSPEADDSTSADASQLWQRSMAWAVGAHLRAGQPCRATLIMHLDLLPADAGALGVARTLHMEHRALCGPALLLDTKGSRMSQQVGQQRLPAYDSITADEQHQPPCCCILCSATGVWA